MSILFQILRLLPFKISHLLTADINILFDGLTDNACGYFTSCIVFSSPAGVRKTVRISKMSAGIICKTTQGRIRYPYYTFSPLLSPCHFICGYSHTQTIRGRAAQ